MHDGDPRVAFVAAQEILNRAYGKPTQAVDVTQKRELAEYSDAELWDIARGERRPSDHVAALLMASWTLAGTVLRGTLLVARCCCEARRLAPIYDREAPPERRGSLLLEPASR
jgi:hypothetical protein